MTTETWLKRVAIVSLAGFVVPALLSEYGVPALLSDADGPGGFGAYVLFALIVLALWAVTAIYLLIFTIVHFKKSGN